MPATSRFASRHLGMTFYDRALVVFAHARADDAPEVIKILCTMATVADMAGDLTRRNQTIDVIAHLASDARLNRPSRPD